MTFKSFIVKMFTAESGISSKRVCGVFGWLVVIGIMIYCTIVVQEAPTMIDLFIIAVMGLLGIDSVTGIFKSKNNDQGFDKIN